MHENVLCFSVEGVTLTIDPTNTVTLYKAPTSIPDQSRIFNCGNIQASTSEVLQAQLLKISRMTRREMNSGATTPVTIAIVLQDQGAVRAPDVVDIQDRNRVPDEQGVEGSIDKTDYRLSFLRIKFNTVAMKCDDAGQYFCEFDYLDKQFASKTETYSVNLTVSGKFLFVLLYKEMTSQFIGLH